MTARVRDDRPGRGQPSGHIDRATFSIPADCICSWSVIRAGVGWACISRLTYVNSLCRHRHVPAAPAVAVPGWGRP